MDQLNLAIRQTRNTTPDEDGISACAYKTFTDGNRDKLLSLFNENFQTWEIPESWKSSPIFSIWNVGKPKAPLSSYRPIAFTSVGCKITERILLKRILDWCLGTSLIKVILVFFLTVTARKPWSYFIPILTEPGLKALKLDIYAAYDFIGFNI